MTVTLAGTQSTRAMGSRFSFRTGAKTSAAVLPSGEVTSSKISHSHTGRSLSLNNTSPRSVRPTIGKMVVNVDITTVLMYRGGPLMDIALEVLQKPPRAYQWLDAPMQDADRRALSKFLARLRITVTHIARPAGKSRGIIGIKGSSAATTKFTKDGTSTTIQQYFEATYRKKLKYPKAVLVEVRHIFLLLISDCVNVNLRDIDWS